MGQHTPAAKGPEIRTRTSDADLPRDLLRPGFLRPSLERVQGLTMVHESALVDLAQQLDVVLTERIPGALVECGVWCGGASFFMADLLRRAGVASRKVWLFDSFEGMPPPQPIDGPAAMQWAATPAKPWYSPRVPYSLDGVRQTAATLGLRDYTVFVKGWFDQTLAAQRERLGAIAILRIDCDWYASVKCCLENLYDQVSPGGFVVLDDYYTYDGCTLAVHEFLAKRALPHRIETAAGDWQGGEVYHGARFRKGPTNWKLEHRGARLDLDIAAHIPPDQRFALVDEDALRSGLSRARWAIPFPERQGEYAGQPVDAEAAIRELERLRAGGVGFAVVAWPALWWLDYLPEFNQHLLSQYRCTLKNDRAVIFDLLRPPRDP